MAQIIKNPATAFSRVDILIVVYAQIIGKMGFKECGKILRRWESWVSRENKPEYILPIHVIVPPDPDLEVVVLRFQSSPVIFPDSAKPISHTCTLQPPYSLIKQHNWST